MTKVTASFLLLCVICNVTCQTQKRLGTCQPLTSALCADMPYNKTFFPNLLHRNADVASLELNTFLPLVKIGCSESLQEFLCRIHFPECSASGLQILPCRNLCLQSQRDCEKVMNSFGFVWPSSLTCSNYPTTNCSTSLQVAVAKMPPTSVCQPFRSSICMDMPYNKTNFPNLLQHKNADSASLEINQFYPLVQIRCSESLQEFLCRTYFPECSTNGLQILPCRDLCHQSQNGCQELMNNFGFAWPSELNCSNYPITDCANSSQQVLTTSLPTRKSTPTIKRQAARRALQQAKKNIKRTSKLMNKVKQLLIKIQKNSNEDGGSLSEFSRANYTITNIGELLRDLSFTFQQMSL